MEIPALSALLSRDQLFVFNVFVCLFCFLLICSKFVIGEQLESFASTSAFDVPIQLFFYVSFHVLRVVFEPKTGPFSILLFRSMELRSMTCVISPTVRQSRTLICNSEFMRQ